MKILIPLTSLIVLFTPSSGRADVERTEALFAKRPRCLILTKFTTRYRVNDFQECRSIARSFLGKEETYELRYPTGFGETYDSVMLSHTISEVVYIYKEQGRKIKRVIRR